MNVQLVQIASRGVPNQERIHLSVTAETDLSYFVVVKSFLAAPSYDRIFAGSAPGFWFPSTRVKPGDQVVLYTGPGTPSNRKEPSGATTFFFYWGMPDTLWNAPADCGVLMQVAEWLTSR